MTLRVIGLLICLVSGTSAAQETIRVGAAVSWPGYSFYEIVRAKNLAPGYEIEITILNDPLAGHALLAAGRLDIYVSTLDYIPVAIDQNLPIVNVAYTNLSYGVDQIVLAPETQPEALAGQRIAAPEAFIGQLMMGVWLDRQGIAPDQVNWVNLNADAAVGPMISGDVAAAYMYEPWVTQVVERVAGARSAASTLEPYFLQNAMFADAIFMNREFIESRRPAALTMLRARWEALRYWHDNTAEANQLMADYLGWPLADVESVIGTNGKFFEGGLYLFDFDESARLCGVLEGEPPFQQQNGGITASVRDINQWWAKLGLLDTLHDPAQGIDCSLMAELVADGYRQSLQARE